MAGNRWVASLSSLVGRLGRLLDEKGCTVEVLRGWFRLGGCHSGSIRDVFCGGSSRVD